MTATRNILSLLGGLGLCLAYARAADPAPADIGIHILEDVSGSEIKKHGIAPADYEDMETLCDVIFGARATGLLGYDVADENGGDNKPLRFTIKPFTEPVPTRQIKPGMTVREKAVALKDFETQKGSFLTKNADWRKTVLDGAKTWCDDCVNRRVEVEAIFLERIRTNHNRDFRRSDLIASIQQANALLVDAKKRYLILNTDMEHQPGKAARDQTVRALNHADIAEAVVIVMVNTTTKPDQSPLLKSLPNKILHAASLKEAATVIAADLAK